VICGRGFVLWCAVGLFCGAVLAAVVSCFVVLWVCLFFCFFPAMVVVVVVGVADGRVVVVGAVMFFKVVGYIILL